MQTEHSTACAPRLTDEPYPSTPQLWPIGAGAAYAGCSVKLLESGIDAGQIPVALHRFGASGKRFVHIGQLKEWVQSRSPKSKPTESNLFE